MNNHTAFISKFENHSEPLISLKMLIDELSQYTNKQPKQIADKLESLLIDYRKGGDREQYTNAFTYCTIFEMATGKIYSEAMSNHFADGLDYVKTPLNEAVSQNTSEIKELSEIGLRRRQFIERLITANSLSFLDKIPQIAEPNISKNSSDYISLYDFIEWAKENYTSYTDTANDLIRLLDGKSLQLYRRYGGIKPSIEKEHTNLKQALEFVARCDGYKDYDNEIPF